MIYERMDCRLCGCPVHTVLELTPTPIANDFPPAPNSGEKYPLGLKQCGNCLHVQIGHVLSDKMLYSPKYKYQTPAALKPQMDARAHILRFQFNDARNVLEIGANNGLFLDSLKKAGFSNTLGVDPSSIHPEVWGVPFDADCAKSVEKRLGKVDLVLANNVFAHIDDLRPVFEAVESILSDDGCLVFEVQYLVPMMDSGAFDMIYHEHRDYHTIGPLQPFLRSVGLIMVNWERFDAHGGSIRVFAKKRGHEIAAPKEETDWHLFAETIALHKKITLSQIDGKIPAFGAPAKATTLIHHFGLQDKISYCVDDTLVKQGNYIAGTAIPVVSRSAMADNPKQMLLFSWNYEELLKKSMPHINFINPFKPKYKLAA